MKVLISDPISVTVFTLLVLGSCHQFQQRFCKLWWSSGANILAYFSGFYIVKSNIWSIHHASGCTLLQDPGRRSTGLQVQAKISFCIAAEYYKGTLTNRFFLRDVWGREGVLPCHVSLTLKNIDFLQLIICCWLELDMSSRAGRDGT